jgi:hypothetical protein
VLTADRRLPEFLAPAGPAGAPGVSTVTFAIMDPNQGGVNGNTFSEIVSKQLPAGIWAAVATANFNGVPLATEQIADATCQLRHGTNVIGYASAAQVPAGGGEVSLWCLNQGNEHVEHAQVMLIQVGSFS